MSTNDRSADGASRLAKIRRYRRLMYACIAVGVVGFVVGVELDYPLVGLAVYWAGILAFFAVWRGTSVQLYDERDTELERRASLVTLQIVGALGVLAMSALVVAGQLSNVEAPDEFIGGFYAVSGLFLLFGAVYTYLRYRR